MARHTVTPVWNDRWVPSAPRLPADEPDTTALATIRGRVARMREGLDGIESVLQSLEQQQRTSERERPTRFYEVLVGVYEHGFHGIDDEALANSQGGMATSDVGSTDSSPEPAPPCAAQRDELSVPLKVTASWRAT